MVLAASNERFRANGSHYSDFRTILVLPLFTLRDG